ncbi:MAG: response regulator [Cyanobacteria bacterium P01_D01_bin.56]
MATILIVEDEVRIATFIAKGLQKTGYLTHVAADGYQALEVASKEAFDLVLLDLGLPGLGGWAVLRELRTEFPELPIIIVTARSGLEERHQSVTLGANDFIAKPFRFKDLLTCIESYVGR